MISVLIPTRKRPIGLIHAVRTLIRNAADSANLDLLFYSDDDDAWALSSLPQSLPHLCRVTEMRAARRGYRRVFELYNELAEKAQGDWLINWNDDVEMLTQGWDALVMQAPPHSVQFFRRDINEKADTTFPCTARSVYQAMGHLSLQTHADDWMRVVAEKAGVTLWRNDIVFHHHRFDDETSRDRDNGGYDTEGFNSPEMQALMAADADRVRAAAPKETAQ